MTTRPSHVAGVLAAAVLWGTTGTVAHFAPAGSSAALIGLATFGFGGMALAALEFGRHRDWAGEPEVPARWLLAGVVGVWLYAGLYYWSMSLAGVAIGNVVALGSGPVFAAVLERVHAKVPVRGFWMVATALAISGVAAIAAGADTSAGPHPLLGIGLALAAGFGYALYTYAGAHLIASGIASNRAMALIFALAAITLIPAFFALGPGPLYSGKGVVVLAYLALVPMAGAYLLFGHALSGMSASTATTMALAEPVVATILAVSVVGERMSVAAWIGMGLVLAGLAVIAWGERRG